MLHIEDQHGNILTISIPKNKNSEEAKKHHETMKNNWHREAALRKAATAQIQNLEREKELLEKQLELERQKNNECIQTLNQKIDDLKASNKALIDQNEQLRKQQDSTTESW